MKKSRITLSIPLLKPPLAFHGLDVFLDKLKRGEEDGVDDTGAAH